MLEFDYIQILCSENPHACMYENRNEEFIAIIMLINSKMYPRARFQAFRLLLHDQAEVQEANRLQLDAESL